MTADPGSWWEFDKLFAEYRLDIASYCSWRTASPADAEDALAEVFLVAWRRLPDIPAGDSARAWLYATSRRVLANQRRSSERRDALRERLGREPSLFSSETEVGGVEEHGVREALARLTDRDREILLLVEWEGLKTEELAEVLGCRHVTARGRLFRARGRFRNFYRLLHQQPDNHWSDQPTALTTRESNS